MMIRIDMPAVDGKRLHDLSALRDVDPPRGILHLKLLFLPVKLHNLMRHLGHAASCRVHHHPDTVRPGRSLTIFIHHLKITETEKVLETVRPGPDGDRLSQAGQMICDDLPGGKDPGQAVFSQPGYADSERLPLKGRGVLKIIDHSCEVEAAVLAALRISDFG